MNRDFETLIGRIAPKLRGIAHRMNGNFTYFSDEDLVQEALTHLWTDFNEGKAGDKTDSYILQGCYFHLKNYLRTNLDKVRPESLEAAIGDDETALAGSLGRPDPAPADAADESTFADIIRREGLGERELRIIALGREGKTLREIGAELGISHVMVLKVRKRLATRLSRIRKILHNHEN